MDFELPDNEDDEAVVKLRLLRRAGYRCEARTRKGFRCAVRSGSVRDGQVLCPGHLAEESIRAGLEDARAGRVTALPWVTEEEHE